MTNYNQGQYHLRRRRQSNRRFGNNLLINLTFFLAGLFMFIYTIRGRTRLRDNDSYDCQLSCLPCDCDCSKKERIMLSLNIDDGKVEEDDQDKNIRSLLKEEIELLKIVSNDTLMQTKASMMDAKKRSSHYQKEAEKCNMGIETCEAGRETAQAELVKELKITKMWKRRAIKLGWTV